VAYRVELIPQAKRELASLSKDVQQRVAREIDKLAHNPRGPGSIKLEGKDYLYRIHAGRNHVIVYQIEDVHVLVLVVRVADRKEVYRNLPKQFFVDPR
jgi:mRNA interferase RelE/StbE